VFKRPTRGWAAGISTLAARDAAQRLLLGKPGVPEEFGTGFIPKHLILDTSTMRGTTDAIDTVQVRHVSGGVSTLTFKSYEQGREKFQSDTLDFGWLDEECPSDIYGEMLARIAATGGMLFLTFTPLKGRSEVVKTFLDEDSPDRAVVIMTIFDAKHISPEMRDKIIAGYKPHERRARAYGEPMLGEGLIFPFADEAISEPRIEHVPPQWTKLWSIDFGITHPFAAILMLYDVEADVAHVHHAIKMMDAMAMQHAVPMKMIAANVPVAWPHDGSERERSTGLTLIQSYKQQGLQVLPEHATWPDGGMSTEFGVQEMSDRMQTGRLKVAEHLTPWFEEKRLYHRRLNKLTGHSEIVKKDDDLLSATRINLMMKRKARALPLGGMAQKRRTQLVASDVEFDLS
jgi:phage terminase large subunit-like protein